MTIIYKQHVAWYLRKLMKMLGFWGVLAFFSMGIMLAFYSSKMAEVEQKLNLATEDIEKKQAKQIASELSNTNGLVKADESLKTLQDFYATFPNVLSLPDTLSSIDKLAKKHRLSLNNGDYKLNKVKSTNAKQSQALAQYEVVLPILGEYQKVRELVADILTQMPSVAIVDIQMRRDTTLVQLLDVRLVLVLFVRGEPA